ncbi:MAG: 3-hydroxyacyl-CoA dehydrogenase/enoyl-CoA hydratase family protein [Flavobacteriales bacterium]|nr:3-hydroxyacyl-CoA dehydrogenase/enoyl-CoA hydratase family protein [Flavobacteriales bacterium]
MKIRRIKKVAIIGSGVMGSRLACHFANAGIKTILLDIVTPGLNEEESGKPEHRNKLVNEALQTALRSNPSPVYNKDVSLLIKTGNIEDHLEWLKDVDWTIEAVVENLEIKKQLFEKLEQFRKPGTLISSNTSGIPISWMSKDRSDDFRAHFCGTHFFNPPRYLPLLEIIPGKDTSEDVVDFLMEFGSLNLGKTTVKCKDTPAFIANRVGIYSIMAVFKLMHELDLNIEIVDSLTGPLTGKPKSATFRTSDVVGLDTLAKVAAGLEMALTNDREKDIFKLPEYVQKMLDKKWLGDKTKQGFYKKTKDENGNRLILALDLKLMEYQMPTKTRFDSVGNARQIENLKDRMKFLSTQTDVAGKFINLLNYHVFQYVSHRIPEISDSLYQIDDAMRAGFGWEYGPFETWDILGVERTLESMEKNNFEVASWIKEMLAKGIRKFYKSENGKAYYYDINSGEYKIIPGRESFILLDNFRSQPAVWQNKGCTLHDIGDGVLNLEFHTKMNTLGSEVLEGINKSIEIAEKEFNGLVLGNNAANFSAGANLAMLFMLAIDQEFDELDMAVRYFQNTVMKLRYSSIPVVIAPHGLTLGGGCEMTLHADSAVAHVETYIGLVEFGVGLIPAGGGTKEFVVRTSDSFYEGDPQLPKLQERFTTIATAKVATSASEAFDLGLLHHDKDLAVMNLQRQLLEAKNKVLELSSAGYVQPVMRDDILVLGRTALGTLYAGTEAFKLSNYASEHDMKIARKLAFVMAGGDLSQPTRVSEQYLLDLEREAFLSLLGEKKTLERIQSILKGGKPLRN